MKPTHSATIIKKDGVRLETADHDIWIRSCSIPSVDVEPEFEDIPGSSVKYHVGNTITREPIELDFDFRAQDRGDFSLLRNDVFRLFHSKEPFHFLDPIEKGKRFLVMARGFRPEEVGNIGRSSVDLVPVNAYAESAATTAGPFTEESGLWGYGMGLPEGVTAADYIKTAGTFDIYNYGDFEVNPREHEFKIQLDSKGGIGSTIRIRNIDTGDIWEYSGLFSGGYRIEVEGIDTKRNGVNANAQTNLGLIRLQPGKNRFEVTGINGDFEIKFLFRFLYN